MLRKSGYEQLYYYKNDSPALEMDFFVRDSDSLVPVEVKAKDGATASLNHLIDWPSYPDVSYGIKFGYKNIGWGGKFYTFPYFLAFLFKAVLDSKDIEAIKAEQKTLKEDYEQHLNKHKETLNQLRESEKSTLSNHRDELKEIMRGESVWLSFKAWMWGIVLVIGFLAVAFGLGFFYAKANYP